VPRSSKSSIKLSADWRGKRRLGGPRIKPVDAQVPTSQDSSTAQEANCEDHQRCASRNAAFKRKAHDSSTGSYGAALPV
jgi:hypothetical protein